MIKKRTTEVCRKGGYAVFCIETLGDNGNRVAAPYFVICGPGGNELPRQYATKEEASAQLGLIPMQKEMPSPPAPRPS